MVAGGLLTNTSCRGYLTISLAKTHQIFLSPIRLKTKSTMGKHFEPVPATWKVAVNFNSFPWGVTGLFQCALPNAHRNTTWSEAKARKKNSCAMVSQPRVTRRNYPGTKVV